LSQQNKTRKKVGRPKLPKGEAKGKIVPVRFTGEYLKAMEQAAKAGKVSLSEWIRSTIHATLQP
jgi:predicted HicB family RNase H-like nuclease